MAEDLLGNDIGDDLGNLESLFDSSYFESLGDDAAFTDQQQGAGGASSAAGAGAAAAPALSAEVDLSGVFGSSPVPPSNNASGGATFASPAGQPGPAAPNPPPVVAHGSAPPSAQRPVAPMVQSQKVATTPLVSAQPTIRTTTVMTAGSMAPQQNFIINAQPAGTAVIQAAPAGAQQGVLQILSAAQPTAVVRAPATVTAAGHAEQQPQLLPKPPVIQAEPGVVVTSAPIILSQASNVVTQQTAGAPLLLNSMGQMQIVGTAAAQPQSPILIQQPAGNSLILMRPNVPAVQPAQAILPVVSQGQILLQRPAPAQPQIKLITPQGVRQMQQIQTPSGPRLVAVPVGQTATLAPAAAAASTGVIANAPLNVISSPSVQGKKVGVPIGQRGALPSNAKPVQAPIQIQQGQTVQLQGQPGLQGQIQLQAPLQLVGQPAGQGQIQLTTSQPSIQIAGQAGQAPIQLTGQLNSQGQLQIAGQPVQGQLQLAAAPGQQANVQLAAQPGQIQLATGQPTGQGHIQVIQQPLQQQQLPQQPLQQQPQPSSVVNVKAGTGDVLGDLVGEFDLDGFGLDDPPQPTAAEDIQLPVEPVPTAASGSQLVAQIQQPLPLQQPPTSNNQLQLVQGPDGQFVLQSTSTTPSIAQTSTISTDGTSQQGTVPVTAPSVGSVSPTKQPPSTSASSTPNRRPVNNDPNRVPLFVDNRLPDGWRRKVVQRKSGMSAGRYEVFIINPSGKRFRSKNEIKAFFEKTAEKNLSADDFDFATYGSGPNLEMARNHSAAVSNSTSPLVAAATPTALPAATAVARPPAPPIVMPTQPVGVTPAAAPPPTQLPPPIVASTAVTSTASNLLQSIQQPVPLQQTTPTSIASLAPVAGPSSSSAASALQVPQQRQFSTQMSSETADADAKITQLLQSMQNETPLTLSNPTSEQVTDLIKGLGDATTPSTPSVTGEIALPPTDAGGTASTAAKSSSSEGGASGGQTDFQAAFLRQIQTRRPSAKEEVEEAARSLSLPTTAVTVASLSPPPLAAEVPSTTTTTTIMGGASSAQLSQTQLQNLPPNSRLVRVRNGQTTQQKVIQLTPESLQALQPVEARMLVMERKTSKTPQELAELAQLQARQQKILSSGRMMDISSAPPMPVSSSSSLSTATNVVSATHPFVASNILQTVPQSGVPGRIEGVPGVGYSAGGPIGDIGSKLTDAGRTVSSAYSAQSMSLTEQQITIIQEFRRQMARLPLDQQPDYLASNKVALLKKLNFQPSQLQKINEFNRKQGTQSEISRLSQQHQQTPPAASVPLPPGAAQGSPHFSTTGGGIVANSVAAACGAIVSNGLERSADSQPQVAGGSSIKSKRTIWVESQIKKDQNEAVNPNYEVKFKGTEDACKRLLRYHVFYDLDRSPEEMEQAEDAFEVKSASMLRKKDSMLKKYHYLLKMESMRPNASSEEVMLARLWETHERTSLAREKEEVTAGRRLQLPPLPRSWADQFGVDVDFGQNVPQEDAEDHPQPAENDEDHPPAAENDEDHPPATENNDEVQEEEAGEGGAEGGRQQQHFGVRFSRSQSGRWGVDAPREDQAAAADEEDYDELQSIRDEIGSAAAAGERTTTGTTASRAFGSDDETDFSLQDVDAAEAVGNIIADMEQESRTEEEDEAAAAAAEAVEAAEAAAATDSAINSVLQEERMETPDFDNLFNLDEAEELLEGDQDPVTEAAVKSIM